MDWLERLSLLGALDHHEGVMTLSVYAQAVRIDSGSPELVPGHLHDPVTFDGSFVDGVRVIADYRFKADWEAYLATFGPEVPKTVARFLEIYETEVA